MRTGKLAGVLCSLGWNNVYTVKRGELGVISITLSSIDNTSSEVRIAHVKQGNAGSIPREDKDAIISPYTLNTTTLIVSELGAESLDDIWVYAGVADKVAASVTTEGLELQRESPRQ